MFQFAHRYGTYRTPDLLEGPKVIFNFLRKMTKPFTGTIAYLSVFQIIASSVITYFETRNYISMRKKMVEIEMKAVAEHQES